MELNDSVDKGFMELFDAIGERLREERQRLRMNQEEMAGVAAQAGAKGTTRQSQALYEKGQRYPDVAYMAAVACAGVDVRYVITGQHSDVLPVDTEEAALLLQYRAAPPGLRDLALRALRGGEPPSTQVTIKGTVGQTVSGNVQMRDLVVAAPEPPPYKVARKKAR